MDYIFKDWQDRLSEFESSVKKDLDEIRKCKAEMQQMKLELASMKKGRVISDNERLILSAPEIIIGHVDEGGMLKEGSASHIIVRGTQVDVHGIGQGGQVAMRAPSIRFKLGGGESGAKHHPTEQRCRGDVLRLSRLYRW